MEDTNESIIAANTKAVNYNNADLEGNVFSRFSNS
jgi:hypothetical protein